MTAMHTSSYEIWVEGRWDEFFIKKLLDKASFETSNFTVSDKQGANQILKLQALEARLAPDKGALAIVLDYDPLVVDEATQRLEHPDKWKSICSQLNRLRYEGPQEPDPSGSVFMRPEYPLVGVWMMPDNQSRGILEDFLANHVFDKDSSMRWAKQVVHDVEAKGLHRYVPKDRPKAIMQTWLAWQKFPGDWRKTDESGMEISSELVQAFFMWIKRVFTIQ